MGVTITGATPIIKSKQVIEVLWNGGTTKVVPLPQTINKDRAIVEYEFYDFSLSAVANQNLAVADFQDNDNVLLERNVAIAADMYCLVTVTEYANAKSRQVIEHTVNTDLSAVTNPSVDVAITSVNKDKVLVYGTVRTNATQNQYDLYSAGYYVQANTNLRLKVPSLNFTSVNVIHKVQILEFN